MFLLIVEWIVERLILVSTDSISTIHISCVNTDKYYINSINVCQFVVNDTRNVLFRKKNSIRIPIS